MSYSIYYPCYSCKKVASTDNPEGCTDGQKIQAAVNDIHNQPCPNSGHQGVGQIVLSCARLEQKTQ